MPKRRSLSESAQRKFSDGNDQTSVPMRRFPSETKHQSTVPKRQFRGESLKTKDPKRSSSNDIWQTKVSKRSIPNESCHMKDPKRNFPSNRSQTKDPKHKCQLVLCCAECADSSGAFMQTFWWGVGAALPSPEQAG